MSCLLYGRWRWTHWINFYLFFSSSSKDTVLGYSTFSIARELWNQLSWPQVFHKLWVQLEHRGISWDRLQIFWHCSIPFFSSHTSKLLYCVGSAVGNSILNIKFKVQPNIKNASGMESVEDAVGRPRMRRWPMFGWREEIIWNGTIILIIDFFPDMRTCARFSALWMILSLCNLFFISSCMKATFLIVSRSERNRCVVKPGFTGVLET